MPTTCWNSHTHEEVINFVKTHKDFIEEGWDENLPPIICETYQEWCDRARMTHGLPSNDAVADYFDFDRLLRDRFACGRAEMGPALYFIGKKNKELYLLHEEEFDEADLSWCWVVSVWR